MITFFIVKQLKEIAKTGTHLGRGAVQVEKLFGAIIENRNRCASTGA